MSKLFYVTLSQGRTDNIYLPANNKSDVLSFLSAVSTAKVTIIKEVLYSKNFLIGTTGERGFTPKPHDQEIKVLFSTASHTSDITIRYPLTNMTNDFIISKVKQYLTYKNETIEDILSIVKR